MVKRNEERVKEAKEEVKEYRKSRYRKPTAVQIRKENRIRDFHMQEPLEGKQRCSCRGHAGHEVVEACLSEKW